MKCKLRKIVVFSLAIISIAGCATRAPSDPNAFKASLVALEMGLAPVSRESAARQIAWRAKNCWIGKIQAFEGFIVSEPQNLQTTGDILESWEVVLSNPNIDSYRIQAMDLNTRGQRAYAMRTVYKEHHKNMHLVVKKAAREIEAGKLGC